MTAPDDPALPPLPPALLVIHAQVAVLRAQLDALAHAVDALSAGMRAGMARAQQGAQDRTMSPVAGMGPVWGAPPPAPPPAGPDATTAALARLDGVPAPANSPLPDGAPT